MLDYVALNAELARRGKDFLNAPEGAIIALDERIVPLVIVMNHLGYETQQSCEGHPLEEFRRRIARNVLGTKNEFYDETPYGFKLEKTFPNGESYTFSFDEAPWITFSRQKTDELGEIVERYNSENPIRWMFEERFTAEHSRLQVVPQYPLQAMQADIKPFAEYLFIHHTR